MNIIDIEDSMQLNYSNVLFYFSSLTLLICVLCIYDKYL